MNMYNGLDSSLNDCPISISGMPEYSQFIQYCYENNLANSDIVLTILDHEANGMVLIPLSLDLLP